MVREDVQPGDSAQSRHERWDSTWRSRSRAWMALGVIMVFGSIFGAGVLLSETESVVVRILACVSVPFGLASGCGIIVTSIRRPSSGVAGPEDVRSRVLRGAPIRFRLDPVVLGANVTAIPGLAVGGGLFVAGIGAMKAEATGFGLGSVSLLAFGAVAVLTAIASVWRYVGEFSIVLSADGLALALGRGYQGHIAWDDLRDVELGGQGRYPLVLRLRQGVQFENHSSHWINHAGALIERAPCGDGYVTLESAGWTSTAGSLPSVLAAYLDQPGEPASSG